MPDDENTRARSRDDRRVCTQDHWMRRGALAVAMMTFMAGQAFAAAHATRPNIVYILSDDHSLQTIGAYDWRLADFCRANAATPNIDRLASQGAIFTRSFCENSICSPSRSSILTGVYSHEHGVQGIEHPMREGVWTFPEAFRAAGYRTAIIGKWHIGSAPRGFDHQETLIGQGKYWDPTFETRKGRVSRIGYSTDVITERAASWLRNERPSDKPFLLLVHHKAPHRTFVPPPRYYEWLKDVDIPEPESLFDDYRGRAEALAQQEMEIGRHMRMEWDLKVVAPGTVPPEIPARERARFEGAFGEENRVFLDHPPRGRDLVRWKYQRYMKNYLRTVRAVDDSVGHVLAVLDELGMADNTIVVYASDQGFYNGEHGWFDKRWIYDESLHMPLIIRWPAQIEPGLRIDALVQNIDHAPTLAMAAGIDVPKSVRGRSLLPFLRGANPPQWRESIYYRYIDGGHKVAMHEGVRTKRHTLVRFWSTDEWELYDLARDPQQLENRIEDPSYADTVRQLRATLADYRVRLAVPSEERSPPPRRTPAERRRNGKAPGGQ